MTKQCPIVCAYICYIFMCVAGVCVHIHVDVCTHMYVYEGKRGLPLLLFILLRQGFSLKLEFTGLASHWTSQICLFPSPEHRHKSPQLAFMWVLGDSNSGFHACVADTLLTELRFIYLLALFSVILYLCVHACVCRGQKITFRSPFSFRDSRDSGLHAQ